MPKIHTCRDIPDELVKSLKKDGITMVDCEFTGLDVGKKGTDRLCLIQICNKESWDANLLMVELVWWSDIMCIVYRGLRNTMTD